MPPAGDRARSDKRRQVPRIGNHSALHHATKKMRNKMQLERFQVETYLHYESRVFLCLQERGNGESNVFFLLFQHAARDSMNTEQTTTFTFVSSTGYTR